MDELAAFEDERPRLRRLAGRILSDNAEADDIVQQAWLRLQGSDQEVVNLAGWLTTVTTRLCLDRLRAKVPTPCDDPVRLVEHVGDPADEVALAGSVGVALQVVLDRLSPGERVAFVLHDSFGVVSSIAAMVVKSKPKLSWSTKATRSPGVNRSRTTCSATPTASARATSSAGSLTCLPSRTGSSHGVGTFARSGPGTAGWSPW